MKYDWFCFWMVLYKEAEKVEFGDDDFSNAREIKKIQILFEKMSEIYLLKFKPSDIAKMWANFDKNKNNSYKEAYNEFAAYLYYATDRMNINRWLYLKMNLNLAFDLAYAKVDASRWHEECGKWNENYESILEVEMNKWFDENFDRLYKEYVKKDDENDL